MTKKITWTLMSFLMAVALVLGSCAAAEEEEAPVVEEEEEEEPAVVTPTVEEEEEEEEVVLPTGPEMVYDSQGKLVEAPQYGGTVYLSLGASLITNITPAKGAVGAPVKEFIYEWMQQSDWTKGPAGTGENSYSGYTILPEFYTGGIAESWERPDDYSLIYYIREGVRFHNKAPAWGREYTAADFISIVSWQWQAPWSYMYVDPATPEEDRTKIELIDDMTVKITYTWTAPIYRPSIWSFHWMAAPEMLWHEAAAGELPWENDWRYACGTGPFILVDFVEDSAMTFVRNDLYWMHDPLHPDNQLPYIDRVIGLDIPDIAIYHSALQTGKIDSGMLGWQKAETFKVQVPEMLWAPGAASMNRVIWFMTDKEPFTDVRVRQALSLAFNNQKLAEEYYGGNALINGWPVQPGLEGYTEVEDMPPDIQKFYVWSPENNVEAIALLADAGFPNGFEIVTHVSWSWGEEIMLIAKDDWAKIGVELEVLMIDSASWEGMLWNKSSPAVIFCPHGGSSCLWIHGGSYPPTADAFGNVIDPIAQQVQSDYGALVSPDQAEERDTMMRQEFFREIALAWDIYTPTPYPLLFWWPWLKNIHGINSLAWSIEVGSMLVYKYVWIDQDLKYEITGSRD